MALRRLSVPSTDPITLAEAKLHLRVEHNDDDALITELIKAAVSEGEQYMDRALITQVWQLSLDAFPEDNAIEIQKGEVQSINSLTYIDSNGNAQVLNSSLYVLDNSSFWTPHFLLPTYGTTWPATRDVSNAVVINWNAGWANAAAVPPSIKHWMKLFIGHYYSQREGDASARDRAWQGVNTYIIDRFRIWPL